MGSDIQFLASSAKVDDSAQNHATGLSTPEFSIGQLKLWPSLRFQAPSSSISSVYFLNRINFVLRSCRESVRAGIRVIAITHWIMRMIE